MNITVQVDSSSYIECIEFYLNDILVETADRHPWEYKITNADNLKLRNTLRARCIPIGSNRPSIKFPPGKLFEDLSSWLNRRNFFLI